jgi:hypothetical protein
MKQNLESHAWTGHEELYSLKTIVLSFRCEIIGQLPPDRRISRESSIISAIINPPQVFESIRRDSRGCHGQSGDCRG